MRQRGSACTKVAAMRPVRLATLAALTILIAPSVADAGSVSQTVSGAIDATNHHYRSTLERVAPVVPGVTWRVLDYNDEIQLVNHSHETVTVFAYAGDQPYLRILPDGNVELNENSPAYYQNQSFFAGGVVPPANATSTAPADWITVAKTGAFLWHDHRIHFTSTAVPFIVKNVDKTTLVFDWTVPIAVGATKGELYGKLVWIGEKPFSFPIGATIAFLLIVLASVALVVVVRRRRAANPAASQEAW
jgi:hypothetical protein